MKQRHLGLLALVTALTIFISSCAGTRPLERMVPAESALYLQIENPNLFLSELDGFLNAVQLNKPGSTARQQLIELFQQKAELPTELIDFSRSTGLSVLPSSVAEDFDFILFIPVSDEAEAVDLDAAFQLSGEAAALSQDAYYIVFSNKKLKEQFPPQEPLDLSRLQDYPDDAVSAYMSFGQLLAAMGLDSHSLRGELAESEVPMDEATQKILNGYLDLFDQMDFAAAWLSADAEGVQAKSELSFSGDVEKFFKHSQPGAPLKEFDSRFIGEGNLFSGIYSFSREDRSRLINLLYQLILPEEKMNSELGKRYMNLVNEMNDAMGDRGIFKANFAINPQAMDLSQIMSLSVQGVSEMNDTETYMQLMRELYGDKELSDFSTALYQNEMMEWRLLWEERLYRDSIPYFELSYDVEPARKLDPNSESFQSDMAQMQMTAMLMEELKFYYAFKDGRCFYNVSLGGDPEGFLQQILDDSLLVPVELQEDPTWLASAADNASIIWSLRLQSVADLFTIIGGPALQIPAEPAEISGSVISAHPLESNILLPADEILWIVQLGQFFQQMSGAQ